MESSILSQKTAYDHQLPRSLHKRLPRKATESIEDDKSATVANLPFTSSTNKQQSASNQYDFSDLNMQDKPPSRSLFDPHLDHLSNSLDGDGENLIGNLIQKPESFNNAFTKNRRIIETSSENLLINEQQSNLPWSNTKQDQNNNLTSDLSSSIIGSSKKFSLTSTSATAAANPALYSANGASNGTANSSKTKISYAVIVYGFTNSNFSSIMNHFAKFGRILEDFSTLTGYKSLGLFSENEKSYPIFMGKSWVKITYDNAQSAVRALAEDGSQEEDTDGQAIHVIPYRAEIARRLLLSEELQQQRQLVGDYHFDVNDVINSDKFDLPNNDKPTIEGLNIGEGLKGFDSLIESNNNYPKNKKLKDGSQLIVKKNKIGILSSGFQINRWLFGTGEI